jgi:hypothetical protein
VSENEYKRELSPLPPDWEPSFSERQYYRNRMNSGDFGWLVRSNGRDMIRLNRPEENLRPYIARDWIPEREPAVLTLFQCAKVTFEADKAFCAGVGEVLLARRDWNLMTETARIAWMKKGPENATGKHADVRRKIYRTLMDLLEPMTR